MVSLLQILPQGQASQDSPDMAAARRRRTQIQRDHRYQRREGLQPSLTPTLQNLRQERDLPGESPPSSPPPLPLSSQLSQASQLSQQSREERESTQVIDLSRHNPPLDLNDPGWRLNPALDDVD